ALQGPWLRRVRVLPEDDSRIRVPLRPGVELACAVLPRLPALGEQEGHLPAEEVLRLVLACRQVPRDGQVWRQTLRCAARNPVRRLRTWRSAARSSQESDNACREDNDSMTDWDSLQGDRSLPGPATVSRPDSLCQTPRSGKTPRRVPPRLAQGQAPSVWGMTGARFPASPGRNGLNSKRMKGLEPSTFCMASRRSSQLSSIRARVE